MKVKRCDECIWMPFGKFCNEYLKENERDRVAKGCIAASRIDKERQEQEYTHGRVIN